MSFRAETVFRFLTEHRALVLAGHAALLVVALSGLRSLRVDYSAEQFFLFGGPEREVFEEFKTHFPREDLQVSALLEVTGPFGLEEFSTLQRLAESFRTAGLDDVLWIGETDFVEETFEDEQPVVTFVRLVDEADLTETRLRSIVEARRDHPLFSGSLWNHDLTVFGVHGYLDPGENNDPRRRQLNRDLEARIAEMSPDPGRIVLNGLPILRVTIPLALESDLVKLLGIGSLISLTVLLVYFLRVRLALLCFAAVLPAIVLTLGGMGLVAGRSPCSRAACPSWCSLWVSPMRHICSWAPAGAGRTASASGTQPWKPSRPSPVPASSRLSRPRSASWVSWPRASA